MQEFELIVEAKRSQWDEYTYSVKAKTENEAIEKLRLQIHKATDLEINTDDIRLTGHDSISMNTNAELEQPEDWNTKSTLLILDRDRNSMWSNGLQDRVDLKKYHLNIQSPKGDVECIHLYQVSASELIEKTAIELLKGNSIYSIIRID